jgi:hypothetical protein
VTITFFLQNVGFAVTLNHYNYIQNISTTRQRGYEVLSVMDTGRSSKRFSSYLAYKPHILRRSVWQLLSITLVPQVIQAVE